MFVLLLIFPAAGSHFFLSHTTIMMAENSDSAAPFLNGSAVVVLSA